MIKTIYAIIIILLNKTVKKYFELFLFYERKIKNINDDNSKC